MITLSNGISGIKTKDWIFYIANTVDESESLLLPFREPQNIIELDTVTDGYLEADSVLNSYANITESGKYLATNNTSISFENFISPDSSSYVTLEVIGTNNKSITISDMDININENGRYYFIYNEEESEWQFINYGFTKIGEIRKDSILVSLEESQDIELNESGKKVLLKEAKLEFSLINLLVDNIKEIERIDRRIVRFVMVSKDLSTMVYIKPIQICPAELFKSGIGSEIKFNLTKKVNDVLEFREIYDISTLMLVP